MEIRKTKPEELNILIGSIPYPEKGLKDPVKLKVLQILNEKYGIVEADFYLWQVTKTLCNGGTPILHHRS